MEGQELSNDQIVESLEEMIDGRATPPQVAAFLVALRGKGETIEEIASFASTFRRHGVRISPRVGGRLVDTCGTGGDSVKTFNVSTVSAIVAAGAGVKVAKHGNRSVTSKCGSADLLESLGFNLSVEPKKVAESIEQVGMGFIFAPTFHPAMKRVAPIRKELGIRTIFNILGPLVNPAGADAQVLGVYSEGLTESMARVLAKLGSEEAMVIHGLEGMDEISVSGRTRVSWLRDGRVASEEVTPQQIGVGSHPSESIRVSSVEESRRLTLEMLDGGSSRLRVGNDGKFDMVVANAAAAIIVAGLAKDFREAVPMAAESVTSGSAYRKLERLVSFSGGRFVGAEGHAAEN